MKILVFCVISTMLMVFSFFQASQSAKLSLSKNSAVGWRNGIGSPAALQSAPIPDHVAYEFLFNRIVSIQRRMVGPANPVATNQVVRTSTDRGAGLNDQQTLILANVAFACMELLTQQDAKARQIIAAYRARFPDGKVPPGVSLPPPPPELKLLQEGRNAIILRARDRLREVFGQEIFNRLDEIVTRPALGKTRSTNSNIR